MDMPVHSNLSYMKAPGSCTSKSATKAKGACSPQAVTVNQLEGGAGHDYSSIGPDYETIDSRSGQSQTKNQVPAGRLPERYEYSKAHLASLNENAPEGLGSANYEVPLNLRQDVSTESEDYSHLKH